MYKIRKSGERGHRNLGWLDTYYTFSFADYYDPDYTGFRALRVINDDKVAPKSGFPTHPHRNMEIITYVLQGSLAHTDSMGNTEVIRAGDIQVMSAGSGITHSEVNPSDSELLHLLQIWIEPGLRNTEPSYEDKSINTRDNPNKLILLASPDKKDGSVKINQDAFVYSACYLKGGNLNYNLDKQRYAYLHLAGGKLKISDTVLNSGDGIFISEEAGFSVIAEDDSEFLIFDLS